MNDATPPDDAIRALLQEHYRLKGQFYCRLAYGFVQRWEMAQELCQDAFAKAWAKRHDIQDWQALGGWIATVVSNAGILHVRRRRHEARLLREKMLQPKDTNDATDAIDDRDEAMHALVQLLDQFRAVVALRLLKGIGNDEVAKLLGLTYGQTAQRFHRGVELMRKGVFRESESPALAPTILKFKTGETDEVKRKTKP